MSCPLCNEKRYINLHTFSTNEIKDRYKKLYGLDVDRFFAKEKLVYYSV